MFNSTSQFTKLLDEKNLRYRVLEAEGPNAPDDRVLMKFQGHYASMETCVFFPEKVQLAGVRIFRVAQVPVESREQVLRLLNQWNRRFVLAKFYLDPSSGFVEIAVDVLYQEDNGAQLCFEALNRAVSTCDMVFPTLLEAMGDFQAKPENS